MNIIEQYLVEKGLEYKEVNGQFNLKVSPISGEAKRNHFYISADNGLRDDKKAGKGGNFNQFRGFFGDDGIVLPEQAYESKPKEYRTIPFEVARQYQQRLWGLEPELLEYLITKRGLEEKTIRNFKIGADAGQITIPIFDSDEVLVNIRRRKNPKDTSDSPKYYAEKGCKSILFNEQVLTKNPAELIVTEGEFDAMVLWQKGFVNVTSTTLGAGYFPEERIDKMKSVKRVYLCYDTDGPGMEGAKKAAEKIGFDRCRLIELPKEPSGQKVDVSDWFNKYDGTREKFIELMKKARMPNVNLDTIKHISDLNEELRTKLLSGDYKGISTGYEGLDKVIGGYRKGRVLVLSGLTSTGKTTFSQNLSLSLAYRNIPLIYISMEMPPIDICKKFLMLHKKLNGNLLENLKPEDAIVSTIDEGLKEFKGDGVTPGFPIYLFNGVGEITLKSVLDVCRVAKESYGVELIVIDHLHYFAQDTKNRTSEVSGIMRSTKNMAMELDIPVLLLAHLNRGGRATQRRGMYVPTLADLRDSGAIEQDADQVVFVCRDSETPNEQEKRKAVIKTAKNRDGRTGYNSFDFDLDIGFFSEMEGVDYLEGDTGQKMKDTTKKKVEGTIDAKDLPF